MTTPEENISVNALFARSLANASKASNLPTSDDETQKLIRSSQEDLTRLVSDIMHLQLFSPNEEIEDVSSGYLVFMSVPFISAEVELNVRAPKREERALHLRQAETRFKSFLSLLDDYSVIPEADKTLYKQRATNITDPAKRRDVKIAQYKREKELKSNIEALCRDRRKADVDTSDIFSTTLTLLSSSSTSEEAEDEYDEYRRETTLLLLRLQAAQANAQLESISQELDLLRSAPPIDGTNVNIPPPVEDTTWRLDSVPRIGNLMDSKGRPLRPFTILPSSMSERTKLQRQVFQPDHRLPTMTIDEYLEIEKERGNIITGGGPQSEERLTTSEQLKLDSEMDGTYEGELKAEEKRLKDEKWAQFTDENPRGSGNTMNRG